MLQIQGISKQFGAKILFEGADAQIGPRSRVALVGPNGSGKTTLLRILLGQEEPDSGIVSRASTVTIGHLAQDLPRFSGKTVLEEVLYRAKPPEDPDLREEGRREALAKEILAGVGFSEADFDRALTELSGGWLMRVALSRVLLEEPSLLCLDEPTNHLDLESLLWLEDFLQGYRGALLLISHDTAFLNRMVSEVLEIDQRRISTYRGNLEDYARQKQERMAVLRAQYEGQQSRIAEIERFVERFGAKATKARQAQSRLKELDRMERIELPEDRSNVRFRFPPAPHSGKEIVTMRHAAMTYGEKTVFRELDWVIRKGSRVAIVGPNGAGKTTLLKLISGKLEPSEGEVRLGHQVQVGYYAQHQAEALNLKKTILEELEQTAPEMPIAQVRAIAGAFLFSGDAVTKKCGILSGGEKARVALAKLLLSPSNFLLLDEPTNHLDVESRGVLLDALDGYEGTLCLVSHDRAFVSPLVDAVLEIEPAAGGSRVTQSVGSYEDYLARLEARMRAQAKARPSSNRPADTARGGLNRTTEAAPAAPTRTGPSNNQRNAWTRERDGLEADITSLERRHAEIQTLLGNTATYDDAATARNLGEELRTVASQLATKLSRWEELCGWLG